MPKGTTFENDILKLIFQATAIANLAQDGSSPITNIYAALHTADPSAGNQLTNEASYSGYARVAVARNAAGFTVTGNNCVNAGAINFPACNGANSSNCTHVSLGMNASAASKVLYSGSLNNALNVSNGITPSFGASNLTVTET